MSEQSFGSHELLPVSHNEHFRLTQLKRLRNVLVQPLTSALHTEHAPNLFKELTSRCPNDIMHPFGYYSIPIFSMDIEHETSSPFLIALRPESDRVFLGPEGKRLRASWSYADKTVYVQNEQFTTTNRILGYITGTNSSLAIEEEAIEHEIRHGLYETRVHDVEETKSINEAFALVSKWGYRFENPELVLHLMGFKDTTLKNIALYQKLFAMAQLLKQDEIKLLEAMEHADFWSQRFQLKDHDVLLITPQNIETQSLEWLGRENLPDLSELRKQQQTQLDRWRLKVWDSVYPFLCEEVSGFGDSWKKEIEKDQAWMEHRGQT